MWNTPPTFAVYVLGLVAEWVESTIGGLDAMYAHNQKKAKLVYDAPMHRPPSTWDTLAKRIDP